MKQIMLQTPLHKIKDLPPPPHLGEGRGGGLLNLCYDEYVSIKFIKMKPLVAISKHVLLGTKEF
jgi:hypothetical protein